MNGCGQIRVWPTVGKLYPPKFSNHVPDEYLSILTKNARQTFCRENKTDTGRPSLMTALEFTSPLNRTNNFLLICNVSYDVQLLLLEKWRTLGNWILCLLWYLYGSQGVYICRTANARQRFPRGGSTSLNRTSFACRCLCWEHDDVTLATIGGGNFLVASSWLQSANVNEYTTKCYIMERCPMPWKFEKVFSDLLEITRR